MDNSSLSTFISDEYKTEITDRLFDKYFTDFAFSKIDILAVASIRVEQKFLDKLKALCNENSVNLQTIKYLGEGDKIFQLYDSISIDGKIIKAKFDIGNDSVPIIFCDEVSIFGDGISFTSGSIRFKKFIKKKVEVKGAQSNGFIVEMSLRIGSDIIGGTDFLLVEKKKEYGVLLNRDIIQKHGILVK